MKKLILAGAALVALLSTTACFEVPQGKAQALLAAQGYTDISIGGYAMTGCGKEDDASSRFSATGANGARVHGVICSGVGFMAKGATVRVEEVDPVPDPYAPPAAATPIPRLANTQRPL